LSLRCRFDP